MNVNVNLTRDIVTSCMVRPRWDTLDKTLTAHSHGMAFSCEPRTLVLHVSKSEFQSTLYASPKLPIHTKTLFCCCAAAPSFASTQTSQSHPCQTGTATFNVRKLLDTDYLHIHYQAPVLLQPSTNTKTIKSPLLFLAIVSSPSSFQLTSLFTRRNTSLLA